MFKYVVECYITTTRTETLIKNAKEDYESRAMRNCIAVGDYFEDENSKIEWARKIEQRTLKDFYNRDVVIN